MCDNFYRGLEGEHMALWYSTMGHSRLVLLDCTRCTNKQPFYWLRNANDPRVSMSGSHMFKENIYPNPTPVSGLHRDMHDELNYSLLCKLHIFWALKITGQLQPHVKKHKTNIGLRALPLRCTQMFISMTKIPRSRYASLDIGEFEDFAHSTVGLCALKHNFFETFRYSTKNHR